MGGQRHAPASLPPGKTRYPLYKRLGGPQERCGPVQKISPPPGFDSRTVQPVAMDNAKYKILRSKIVILWVPILETKRSSCTKALEIRYNNQILGSTRMQNLLKSSSKSILLHPLLLADYRCLLRLTGVVIRSNLNL